MTSIEGEKIYRYDLVNGLEKVQGTSVAQIIENTVSQDRLTERFLVVYQKTTGTNTDDEARRQELKGTAPLIAFWPGASLPLLSDPENNVKGAVAIDTKARILLYSPNAIALHQMRDSYRWSYAASTRYYVLQKFLETIDEFLGHGYSLYSSDFTVVDQPSGLQIIKQREISQTGFTFKNPSI